jgi:hypothetical protein
MGLDWEAGMTRAAMGMPRNGVLGCAALLLFTISVPGNASAQADDAERILKAMSDYLISQKAMLVSFDTDIEVITPDRAVAVGAGAAAAGTTAYYSSRCVQTVDAYGRVYTKC